MQSRSAATSCGHPRAKRAFLREPRHDRPAAVQPVLEAILPRKLGGGIDPAHGFQRARDRPDVRVQARLQRDHRANRVDAARRVHDALHRRRNPPLLVPVTHDGREELGPIGEVQIDGLTRDARRPRHLRQLDVGAAAFDQQFQRGVEEAAARGRVARRAA